MKQIDRIVEKLILNGTLTDHPGLFYGKTGIAIFFFHYARHTGERLFQDYAFDLVEEIREQITETSLVRYDTGLAGIGAGFEYLLKNGFIEAEGNDLFDDFDTRIHRAAMYEPYYNLSLEDGWTGWGRYFIFRIRGSGSKIYKLNEALKHISKEIALKIEKKMVPEKEQPDVYRFFRDLITLPDFTKKYADTFKLCREWKCIRKPDISSMFHYLNDLQRLYVCQNYFKMDLRDKIEKEWEKWKESDTDSLTDMGLLKGWTAEGFFYLTCYENGDVSWINLL